jgi:hypothetical protein
MYSIEQVTGEDVLIRYNNIKHQLDRALEHSDGEWTAAQIVHQAITDPTMFHIWEVLKDGAPIAVASSRVIEYNNFTSLHIITIGGSDIYEQMPMLITEFEQMIKKYEQIDFLEYTGRRGFIKQLNTVGWKEMYVTMRKNLKENLDV